MKGLAPRQREVLDFIRAFIAENLVPPTWREIGDAVGCVSTNSVSYHLRALERKGYLSFRKAKSSRTMVLADDPRIAPPQVCAACDAHLDTEYGEGSSCCLMLTLSTQMEVQFRLLLAADTAIELAALIEAQKQDQNETATGLQPSGRESGNGGPTR